jgi:hypothetical protein
MYLIGGHRFEVGDPGFIEALASAHALRSRPICLCNDASVEMYVARFGGEYLIKRMPYTGSQHAPDCFSYEPPEEFCGSGGHTGSAIVEDPDTGLTSVRLGFALARWGGRAGYLETTGLAEDVSRTGSTLSLADLLRYLWARAELTRWRPEFEGKRSWSTVRRLLLAVAWSANTRGEPLVNRLYVPERFAPERRVEIEARRLTLFAKVATRPAGVRKLLLLCGDVKELSPSKHGWNAVIRHVPDQPFALDEDLFRRMERRFEQELSLWSTAGACRLVMLATFAVNRVGVPAIEQLTLLPVDEHWIPVRDVFDLQLVQRLIRERRRFIKALPIDPRAPSDSVRALLTDTGSAPTALRVSDGAKAQSQALAHDSIVEQDSWLWQVDADSMPELPLPSGNRRQEHATTRP